MEAAQNGKGISRQYTGECVISDWRSEMAESECENRPGVQISALNSDRRVRGMAESGQAAMTP
jgi:hypothetical protein